MAGPASNMKRCPKHWISFKEFYIDPGVQETIWEDPEPISELKNHQIYRFFTKFEKIFHSSQLKKSMCPRKGTIFKVYDFESIYFLLTETPDSHWFLLPPSVRRPLSQHPHYIQSFVILQNFSKVKSWRVSSSDIRIWSLEKPVCVFGFALQ